MIDYMARDYDSLLEAMRAMIPCKLPEWKDYRSEADFGNVLLELFAHIGDILSYYQDRVANESFLGTAQSRRSVIEHLRLIGYTLSTAAPAATSLALTMPGTFTGTITIHKGDAFATKSQKERPSVRFEYTGDDPLTFDFNSPDVTTFPQSGAKSYIWKEPKTGAKTFVCLDATGKPRLDATGKPLGCLPVEEGRLIRDEILGISAGSPNQHFTLARPGLLLLSLGLAQTVQRDLLLQTQLGDAMTIWTRQESLAFSRADQKDYVVTIDENDRATIVFGDGLLGAIPPKGAAIKVAYRIGGGQAGNVPAYAIETIVNATPLALAGGKVTNPLPATGGAERESIEHAVLHAPAVFRSLKRAVTAADYEALAANVKGVGKVRARSTSWNTVTLAVAPEGGGKVSDVLEANLLNFFADKRILGQNVEIADVDYVPIYVTAEVNVNSYYARTDIVARVQAAASQVLAFKKVHFGQSIYLSKFYEKIEEIEGVEYVYISEFRRPPQPAGAVEEHGKIDLRADEVPVIPADKDYAAGIKVVISKGGY